MRKFSTAAKITRELTTDTKGSFDYDDAIRRELAHKIVAEMPKAELSQLFNIKRVDPAEIHSWQENLMTEDQRARIAELRRNGFIEYSAYILTNIY